MSRSDDIDRMLSQAASEQLAGRADTAGALLIRMLDLDPNHAGALTFGALLALRSGRIAEAASYARRATIAQPSRGRAHHLLGLALHAAGQTSESVASLERALALAPEAIDVQLDFGNALLDAGDLAAARANIVAAAGRAPNSAIAWNSLGNVCARQGEFAAAVDAYHKAITIDPRLAQAHANLGRVLFATGDGEAAIAAFRRSIAITPDRAEIRSALLLALTCSNSVSAAELFIEHQAFGDYFGQLIPALPRRAIRRRAAGRLKVGYVSSDFRRHAVGVFVEPLLGAHNHDEFEIFCYYNGVTADDVTERCRSAADHFVSVAGLDDAELARKIRDDAIDILVDLNGHSTGNRLPVFLRRPAPVQVTWLGYLGTTGVAAIDYRLTDPYADPPGASDRMHVEKLIRLDRTQWCYRHYAEAPAPLRVTEREVDGVTFICLNHPAKISSAALARWAEILGELPHARLIMLSPEFKPHRDNIAAYFSARGVASARIEQVGQLPVADYLASYNRADIALDSFPCAGGTTTCDALWMGVPVVTLAGDRPFSRSGASMLRNVGLAELVVDDTADYVRVAVDLARDRQRLLALRLSLRQRMEASPLCDAYAFARKVEAAFDAIWQQAEARAYE